jgi:hypothetical protein
VHGFPDVMARLVWRLRKINPEIANHFGCPATSFKLRLWVRGEPMPTSEDYRRLAERCALLASECTPGVAEALGMLALDYLTKAALPAGRPLHRMQRD